MALDGALLFTRVCARWREKRTERLTYRRIGWVLLWSVGQEDPSELKIFPPYGSASNACVRAR